MSLILMDNYSVILLAGITPVLKDIHLEKTSHSVDMWRYPPLSAHTHTSQLLLCSLLFISSQVRYDDEVKRVIL